MDSIQDVEFEVVCTCMYNCVNVQNIVISISIYVPSLELFAKTVLDLLEERAILIFNQG